MNQNIRMHAMFIIGSDTLPKDKLNEVLDGINRRYGGCTLHVGHGSWSENGATFTDNYDCVKFETAYQIDVCTTLEEFDLEYLKLAFVPANEHAQWIHCEVWQTHAEHFDITNM